MAQVAKKKSVGVSVKVKAKKSKPNLPAAKSATPAEMAAKTVMLLVNFSGISNNRRVDKSMVEVDADKEMIAVTKRLVDHKELVPIYAIEGEVRRYLDRRALPSMLKRGAYLLPTAFIEQVDAKLTEFAEKRQGLVNTFIDKYQELVKEAKKRLKSLFNEDEYPTADYLRAAFTLTWQLRAFTVPVSIEQVQREIYERERVKAEAEWVETRAVIQQTLRSSLLEMVTHMKDKLTQDDKTGKKRKFKDSSVLKLQDFLQVFDKLDITNDVQLKTMVEQAKGLVSGVDPEALRENEGLRQQVQTGFTQIAKVLDTMVEDKPTRHIVLED